MEKLRRVKYNFEVMSIEFVAENIILRSYKFY